MSTTAFSGFLQRLLSASSSSSSTLATNITYNDQQQIILALLPIVPGLLSMIGSASILYLILRGPDSAHTSRRLGKMSSPGSPKPTYERIMIGMCCIDLSNNFLSVSTTFLLPRDTPGVWKPFGTQATCTMYGLLAQFGFGVSLYSASLAIYFLLSINPSIKDSTISTKYEPFLHGIPLLFGTVTAVLGLILDSYNPVPLGIGCWVSAYPFGCVTVNDDGNDDYSACTRGHNAGFLLWVFGGIPIIVSYIIIIGCMGGIYYSVWNQIRKMEVRYSSTSRSISRGTSTTNSSSPLDASGITTMANGSSASLIVAPTSSLTRSRGTNQRLKRVRNQAFLYIAIFFVTFIWPSINRIVESQNTDTSVSNGYFIVSMFSQIFLPLHGFLNFFIYIRPRYFELRKQFPNITLRDIVKLIFGYQTISDYTNNTSSMTASATAAMLKRPKSLNGCIVSSTKSGDNNNNTDNEGTTSSLNESIAIPSFPSQHTSLCISTRNLYIDDAVTKDGIMMDDENNNNNSNNIGDKILANSIAGIASTVEVLDNESVHNDCEKEDAIKTLSYNDKTSESSIPSENIEK